MAADALGELWDRLHLLERKIQPLDWDCRRNQINEFKRMELGRLKTEYASLMEEMKRQQSSSESISSGSISSELIQQ